MPAPIYLLIFAFVLLVLLGVNGVSPTYQWAILPVIVVVLAGMLYWLSTRTIKNTAGTNNTPSPVGKWLLYGGGVVGLVILIFWADWIWEKIQTGSVLFASNTGLGKMLADHYGQAAAETVGWVIPTAALLLVVAYILRAAPWGSILPLLGVIAVLAFIFFLATDEIRHWSFQNDAHERQQARLDDFYERGPPRQVQIPACSVAWVEISLEPGWQIQWDLPVIADALTRKNGWESVPDGAFVEKAKKFRFCSPNAALVGVMMDLNPTRID